MNRDGVVVGWLDGMAGETVDSFCLAGDFHTITRSQWRASGSLQRYSATKDAGNGGTP